MVFYEHSQARIISTETQSERAVQPHLFVFCIYIISIQSIYQKYVIEIYSFDMRFFPTNVTKSSIYCTGILWFTKVFNKILTLAIILIFNYTKSTRLTMYKKINRSFKCKKLRKYFKHVTHKNSVLCGFTILQFQHGKNFYFHFSKLNYVSLGNILT